jgi:multidrug resistance efflux pump
MIIVMVLAYVAVLFLLVKIGVIKLNTFWKISPLLWAVACFIVFFLPMQWGAPQGPVRYMQQILRVVPNVSGEVIEVHVEPWQKVKAGQPLFTIDPEPFQATVDSLTAQLKLAELRLEQSKKLFARGAGPEYEVQQYASQVASLKGQIVSAQWNLDSTQVRAQSDGVVMGVTVSPGQRATNTGSQTYVTLVESRGGWIVGLNQNVLRHVHVGQPVEVALKARPGRVYTGHVSAISATNPEGTIASGAIVSPPDGTMTRYAIMVQLEGDPFPDRVDKFGGGASGVAAIYTDSAKPTQVIRKIMIRMQTWKDYVLAG